MQFNRYLKDIKSYEAGKPIELVAREHGIAPENIVKLASNENPFGCSPKVKEAVANSASLMYRYPDDSMYTLKSKLCDKFSVKRENLIVGSGSDQVIEMMIRAKCEEGSKILIAGITFAMYEIYAKQVGAEVLKIDSDMHHLEQFLDIYKKERPEIIFLCLPNNPLGECLDKDEVYSFLEQIDHNTMVILDGAYQEYAKFKDDKKEITPSDVILRFDNVVYLGTFSKAYGLGGMRIGYGIANKEIIDAAYKMRPPFNITTLSLIAAQSALEDENYVQECIKDSFLEMSRYESLVRELNLDFIESYTNFITILLKNSKLNSIEIFNKLFSQGVIVRDLAGYGIDAIRVTIGKKAENDRFFELFSQNMNKNCY